MTKREMTVKEWLQHLTTTNTSTEYDDKVMQTLTRKCGFTKSIVTCGIVYLEGYGDPMDIHTIAKAMLKRQS